ncbi:acetolactate synthase AlsS [Lactococcus fujiensis]|uniref:Acetolactate synthase n=1 Tax=Lactococcus fujiensis JCM 16395 TaxID=1291764 RepID=A0A2A5RJC7_9LACT|nr:acetolactate synthase AlsS [Lactococcus fujiensis]PCR99228.1 acetolactate synthase [Lactococcus fujiensis JCM 16395]
MAEKKYGSDLIVDSLINHDVKYVFGIPGAKIDHVFDRLESDENAPQLIVTRHEQGAAFMAQAVGRLTGKPGVALVTSGPGVSNLATGLLTATAEGDAVLAIGGQVKRGDLLKRSHQSMKNAELFAPITKYSAEVQEPSTLSETIANAWRVAKSGKHGASFLSIPQDVTDAEVTVKAIKPMSEPKMGNASIDDINYLAQAIKNAVLPVILVGTGGSDPKVAQALRNLLTHVSIPVVETFQGAGVISRDLEHTFFGRVGLFRNQPGDMLLKRADLVIAVGYDPIEYEARNWNAEIDSRVVVIDNAIAEIDTYFQPERELIGNIAQTLENLLPAVRGYELPEGSIEYLTDLREIMNYRDEEVKHEEGRIHPLELVDAFQSIVKDDETVTVDVGSLYIWMARYFKSYEPRHLLFSNGMQTLGVALPWAITAGLLRPNKRVYSMSGDGGMLFTGQELETAVRLNLPIVHIIWNDGHFDMVKFQEEKKYGRSSGVDFGPVDYVKYAESMGAKGYRATSTEEFLEIIKNIPETSGPVLIDIPIDYSDNIKLADTLLPEEFY